MNLFSRHKKTTLFLFCYYAWWAFMAWYVINIRTKGIRCDFSPIFFLKTIPLSFIVACIFLAKHLDIKSNTNNDFMVFIALLFLPYLPALYFAPYHLLGNKPAKILCKPLT
jgi:hypothetical protein